MNEDRDDDESEEEFSPSLGCWFCGHSFTVRQVLRDGILRSRAELAGGPYRLFLCPACGRENACEKTLKGRWFSSPNFKLSFLDYFFTQMLDAGTAEAENLLRAISWFQDNEERRRYFFERDGDRRYSAGSFLRRLWPTLEPEGSTGGRLRPDQKSPGEFRPRSEPGPGPKRSARDEEEVRLPPRRSGMVTPEEILGVRPRATEREIRAAFHRLAVHYHPDKVHHRGEEFERMAHEKFLRLKEAYEILLARKTKPT
jgi:hypothetical protein